ARQGTREWVLNSPRIDPVTPFRCPWIEGYCSQTSVAAGGRLDVHVSANPESAFTLDIYRMGYYGGAGGGHVAPFGPLNAATQPEPPVGERRLRECVWDVSLSIEIPGHWISGVYLGKLTATRSGIQSYIIFILRDDRKADFILKTSDTTWHAY